MKQLLAGSLFLMCSFHSDTKLQKTPPFAEQNGIVRVEAEKFHTKTANGTARDWYIRTKSDSLSFDGTTMTNRHASASKGAYIEALPDTRVTHDDPLIQGVNFFPEPGVGAIVSYQVDFRTTGTYYVWASAFSTGSEDNGVHVGLDGDWPATAARMQWCKGKDEWTWSSAQRDPDNHCGIPKTIHLEITTPGVHTISFSMREDGFEMDTWIMTNDSDFDPNK